MGLKRINSDFANEAMEYMKRWDQSDEYWDDLSVMIMEGDDELAAYHLCTAGAINSRNCYPEFKQVEQAIELMAKRFGKLSHKQQRARYDGVFNGCLVCSCNECNHVSFVHSGNEELYPEVKEKCWSCKSSDIEVKRWEK